MEQNKILILTHGRFGEELVKSAEMIVGEIKNIKVFSLMPEMSAEDYRNKVADYLKEVDNEVISLVDLFGGTPSNTVAALSQKFDIEIISGLNLPMLLEVYMNLSEKSTKELADLAIDTLNSSGKNISRLLNK